MENTTSTQVQTKLPGPTELIKSSWELLKLKWKKIFGVYLFFIGIMYFIGIVLLIMLLLTSPFSLEGLGYREASPISYLVIFFVYICFTFLLLCMQASVFLILGKKELGFIDSIKAGIKYFIPLFFASLLVGLIVIGGYMLFIIPGLLFAIWFMFTLYVVVLEDKRGFDALFTSKEYVRGNFLAIFGRMLLFLLFAIGVGIVGGIITGVLHSISDSIIFTGLGQIVSFAVNIIISLLGFLYMYKIYEAVRNQKKDVKVVVSGGMKAGFIAFALFGLLLPLGMVIALVVINPKARMEDALQQQMQNKTEQDIENMFEQVMPSDFPLDEQGQIDQEEFQKQMEENLPPELQKYLDSMPSIPPEVPST